MKDVYLFIFLKRKQFELLIKQSEIQKGVKT